MDYSKTNKQLQDIANGIIEIDSKENALIAIRRDKDQTTLLMVGSSQNLFNAILNAMDNDKAFYDMISRAMFLKTMKKVLSGCIAEKCKTCDEPDCKGRQAEYEKK